MGRISLANIEKLKTLAYEELSKRVKVNGVGTTWDGKLFRYALKINLDKEVADLPTSFGGMPVIYEVVGPASIDDW